MTHYNESD